MLSKLRYSHDFLGVLCPILDFNLPDQLSTNFRLKSILSDPDIRKSKVDILLGLGIQTDVVKIKIFS